MFMFMFLFFGFLFAWFLPKFTYVVVGLFVTLTLTNLAADPVGSVVVWCIYAFGYWIVSNSTKESSYA